MAHKTYKKVSDSQEYVLNKDGKLITVEEAKKENPDVVIPTDVEELSDADFAKKFPNA